MAVDLHRPVDDYDGIAEGCVCSGSIYPSGNRTWNSRLDADLYGQRSQNETVNSCIKRKYGALVRSRLWWKQFRELVVGCLTHNIDKAL